jgi:hypothetical protein
MDEVYDEARNATPPIIGAGSFAASCPGADGARAAAVLPAVSEDLVDGSDPLSGTTLAVKNQKTVTNLSLNYD